MFERFMKTYATSVCQNPNFVGQLSELQINKGSLEQKAFNTIIFACKSNDIHCLVREKSIDKISLGNSRFFLRWISQ